jgi:transposase
MAIADRTGLPIALGIESASPHEVRPVADTLRKRFTKRNPKILIGDKAYDSDPLDQQVRAEFGVELVAPHKGNRKSKRTQDGRTLRRYTRRWKIERLFAWLQNFRRIVTRWEYKSENYLGMVQLGCIVILLRYL